MTFFERVLKTVKKVAPIVLGAATIFFTAGAALGIPGTAGGWGGAVSSLVETVGLDGVLGNALTGAITQAGYGAAMGGMVSALGGGDVSDGAGIGALAGAATGGTMGALGMQTDPLAGAFEDDPPVTAQGAGTTNPPATNSVGSDQMPLSSAQAAAVDKPLAAATSNTQWSQSPGLQAATEGPAAVQAAAQTAATSSSVQPPASGGVFGEGGWMERNQGLAGGLVKGAGQGLIAMASAGDEADAAERIAELKMQQDEAQRDAVAANYGVSDGRQQQIGRGLLTMADAQRQMGRQPSRPTPKQAFDDRYVDGRTSRYVWDRRAGRMVVVPAGAAV